MTLGADSMNSTSQVIDGSPAKMARIAFGGASFAGIALFSALQDKHFGWLGWLSAGALGVCVIVGVASFLRPPRLLLTEQGLEMHSPLSKPTVLAWSDVLRFYMTNMRGAEVIGSAKVIGIEYSPTYTRLSALRSFIKPLTGVEGALRNVYAMRAEEVCLVLNEWRNRYGVQPGAPADAPALRAGGPSGPSGPRRN